MQGFQDNEQNRNKMATNRPFITLAIMQGLQNSEEN